MQQPPEEPVTGYRPFAIFWTLGMIGIAAAFTGFVAAILAIGLVTSVNATWLGPKWLIPLLAAFCALLLGPCLWWHIIIKPRRLTVIRGMYVGILGSLLAHPLTWLLVYLLGALWNITRGTSFVENHLAYYLVMTVLLSLASLIVFGWLTALIGGLAGAAAASLQSANRCPQRWYATN